MKRRSHTPVLPYLSNNVSWIACITSCRCEIFLHPHNFLFFIFSNLSLQDTPTDSARYAELIRSITANFDEFKESSSHNVFNKHSGSGNKHTPTGHNNNNNNNGGSGENGAASRQEADAAFLNYTYKRKPVSLTIRLVALFIFRCIFCS